MSSGVCNSCPVGKVSPPGSTSVSQCEVNQISVNFQIDNVNPNRSQADFRNALPPNVVVDSYVDVIVSQQGSCPTGFYCPPDTTAPLPCPAGTYNNVSGRNDVGDCLVCPAGQYCPLNSTLPADCNAGSYRGTEGGVAQASCTTCPSGNYCPVQSVNPTNCTAGTYNPASGGAAVSSCLACLQGNFCPIATTTPTQCAGGSYRGTVGGVDQNSCTACPSGNYCPQGAVNPTNCTAGTYRASPSASAPSDCLACPPAQYCIQATTTPADCNAGSYRGTEGGVAQASCATCPSGNYCPVKSVNPTNCSAGKYNPSTGQGDVAACIPCPAGGYCPVATTTPPLCAANTFTATTGAAVCDACPVYSTSPIASTNCTCNAGHYHVVSGSSGSSATQSFSLERLDTIYNNIRPDTYKFLQSGGKSHISVTKGATVSFTSQRYGVSNVVVPLRIYSKLNQPSVYGIFYFDLDSNWAGVQMADIIPRPSSMISAFQLALNYSVGVTGQGTDMLVWDTTDVPSNLYFVGAPMSSNDAPLSVFVASPTPTTISYFPVIPYGIISITAACLGDTLILNKPTGNVLYTATPYKDIVVSCIPLADTNDPPTITVLASGQSPLTWVVAGVDDTMQCYVSYGPLPTDSWGDAAYFYSLITVYPRPGAIGVGSSTLTCSNCSSGYRSSPGAPACTECGLGYYSNPVSETCTICPVGTKCPTATTPAPVDCGVGYYQSQTTQSVCLPCPTGKYCDLARTVTPVSCPAGTFRDTEGAASLSDCQACPKGKFCLISTTNPSSCAAGSYRDTLGAASQAECPVCTTGHYCPVSSIDPTDCAAGTYNGLTGQDEASDCQTCTRGNYCPIASVSPTNCAAGTYNGLTGQDEASDCQTCTTGNYCPIASVSPTNCAAGTYNGLTGQDEASDCQTCTTGNYCPIASVSPTNCAPGTFNGLTGQDEASDCKTCTTGNYCPIASVSPTNCSAGTYNGLTGQDEASDCQTCTTGNYCPIASVSPTLCVAGTYNPSLGSTNSSFCLGCDTGKYSLAVGRSNDCPFCVAGSFCVNPTTVQLCPTHTSSQEGSSSLLDCRCLEGFQCSYTKQITATVTLNTSYSTFTSDVGGVQTLFKQQVADAAGVQPSQVVIKNVAPKLVGRRLLGVSVPSQLIDVRMVVNGAAGLRNLHRHIAKHDPYLYQGHVWAEAHRISSQPVARRVGLFS